MIGRACLFLEILSVVLCLHRLYGRKFRFDIITVSFLSIYMIAMTAINYYNLSKPYTMIIYPLIVIYCGVKFGFQWRALIINNILYVLLIGGIQLITIICYGCIFNMLNIDMLKFRNSELLIGSGVVLLVILLILPRFKIYKLSLYLQDKEKIMVFFLIFCILLTIVCVANFKVFDGLRVYQSFVIFISLSLFCLLAGQLGKYKIKSKEIETELKTHKLYADSFQNLIDDIRMRQHEFDNHISAIYSLHYTCDSYEKLVKAQNEYSHAIIKENRYNKLLKVGNPLLIGFLYGKFIEMEKLGIEITYQISIDSLEIDVPIYKLVEILGNLIKNAAEAIQGCDTAKALYIAVTEINGIFEIEVRNKSIFVEYDKIEFFFKKGYSAKGKNRGLGLYNVKNICDEYHLNIFCENKNISNENWLCFSINNKKKPFD